MKNKVKIYCMGALALALALTFLRVISLAAFYDAMLGYFSVSPIPIFMNILCVASSAWCLSAIFTTKQDPIVTLATPSLTHFKSASAFSAALFLVSAIAVFAARGSSRLSFICTVSLVISSLFFLLALWGKEKSESVRAFASIAPTASFIFILASLYFNLTIAMNSPHKIHGSFVLMSAMVMFLCETRLFLGKPLHRLHLAVSLLTFVLGIPFALSSVIFIFTAAPSPFIENPIILGNAGYVGVILGISVYAVSRAFSFNMTAHGDTELPSEASIQKQENI